MDHQPSIYLASPLGFTSYGAAFARELVSLVHQAGAIALDPWSSSAGAELAQLVAEGAPVAQIAAANQRVGSANTAMLDSCDGILACLDGTAVDDGTAAEIGYGTARGRVIAGFRTDQRTSGDNVASSVNLQIEYFIAESGGAIFRTADEAIEFLVDTLR